MKNRNNKMKKNIAIGAGIVGLFILAVLVIFFVKKNQQKPSDEAVSEDAAVEENELNQSEDGIPENLEPYMTINLFPGFTGNAADEVLEGSLSNSDILLEYAGSYDGIFYEDGSETEKEDVFSLIITNISEDTLEVMQLWIEDENGDTYQFQLSALPSGGTVLVQELEGKTFDETCSYRIVNDTFGFMESEIWMGDLQVEENGDTIIVRNNGTTATGPIQLIYKNWMGTYVYIGGIAYRISLDNLEAGEALQITADHYKDGESRVTGIKQFTELSTPQEEAKE